VRVAVAGKAQRLGLELRAGPLEAVHEEDRIALDLGGRLGSGRERQHSGQREPQDRPPRKPAPCVHRLLPSFSVPWRAGLCRGPRCVTPPTAGRSFACVLRSRRAVFPSLAKVPEVLRSEGTGHGLPHWLNNLQIGRARRLRSAPNAGLASAGRHPLGRGAELDPAG
jgi:hypothetical protein